MTEDPARPAAIPGGAPHVPLHVTPVSRADRAADAALLAGLALDDPDVSAAFVRRFQGAVFGMAVSITRDPALAEDVAQDVFVRVWRAAGGYDGRRASVLTWVLTITRNAAIDAVRAGRLTPTDDELLESLVQDATSMAGDLQDSTVHRLEAEEAVRRLHRVSPEQARAVVLAALAGCTAAEVAEREGIPLGTAKTRIRTGLRRLRAVMEETHE